LDRDEVTGGVRAAFAADVPDEAILVHDAHNPDPTTAFAISRLTDTGSLDQTPIGIFRQVVRPTYDDQVRAQASTRRDLDDLQALIDGGDVWTVEEDR